MTYGYDRLGRLTSAQDTGGTRSYGYDPVGNRTSSGAAAYTYDRADRTLTAAGSPVTVDADGNLTARGSNTFTYDAANRLVSATVGGTTEAYTYDGDGTRSTRQVGANPITRYATDTGGQLPATIADGTRKYVYGLGLVYVVTGSAVEVVHPDLVGSIRSITDGTAAVTATFKYDEWGHLVSSTGSSAQPFGFAGQPKDATGLSYLRARYLDPTLGRFISRDTWAGGTAAPTTQNRYAYAFDGPISRADPSGRFTVAICLSINVRWFIFGGEGQACFVAASSLEIGVTTAYGGGGAAGANGSVGLEASVGSGNYVEDLAGPFVNYGGSGEAIAGGSGSVFAGTGTCGQPVFGGNFGPSLGGGAEVHTTVTNTDVRWRFGAAPAPCSMKSEVLR